jgi:hypothetical protein
VVLYGCETWSLILKEEKGLPVFENRVLRGLFGPTREEGTELHNEELRDLYPSPRIIRLIESRRMRGAGHVARMRKRNAYKLLVGNRERKKRIERPRRR